MTKNHFLNELHIQREHALQIAEEISAHLGEEVCGLLAGQEKIATRQIAIKNASSTPKTNFAMNESELLAALKKLDAANERVLATYHTHPSGQLIPSQEDIRLLSLNWPNVIHVIAGVRENQLVLKGWQITSDHTLTVPIYVDQPDKRTSQSERLSRAQQVAIILTAVLSIMIVVIVAITLLPPPPDLTLPTR